MSLTLLQGNVHVFAHLDLLAVNVRVFYSWKELRQCMEYVERIKPVGLILKVRRVKDGLQFVPIVYVMDKKKSNSKLFMFHSIAVLT